MQRRQHYILATGLDPDSYYPYQPLNLHVRCHSKDVLDQDEGCPPQPLTIAIFGRSGIDIGTDCETASLDSRIPGDVKRLSGGEVASLNSTILWSQCRVRGNVKGRSIEMKGSGSHRYEGGMNANSDIPMPIPMSPPPVPSFQDKVVNAVVIDNCIKPADGGQLANLQDLVVDRGKEMSICPGDYLLTSLKISGGRLKIETWQVMTKWRALSQEQRRLFDFLSQIHMLLKVPILCVEPAAT
jgi:hypothetical protein